MEPTHEITELLHAWNDGDEEAFNRLMTLVDPELKRLARNYMSQERPGHILQPTALVNESLIKIIRENVELKDRHQFYGFIARRMRQVLTDYARKEQTDRRGNRPEQVDPAEAERLSSPEAIKKAREVVTLDEALAELGNIEKRQMAVVEYRFFIGLSIKETAAIMGIAERTVQRDWSVAEAWLKRYMMTSDAE